LYAAAVQHARTQQASKGGAARVTIITQKKKMGCASKIERKSGAALGPTPLGDVYVSFTSFFTPGTTPNPSALLVCDTDKKTSKSTIPTFSIAVKSIKCLALNLSQII